MKEIVFTYLFANLFNAWLNRGQLIFAFVLNLIRHHTSCSLWKTPGMRGREEKANHILVLLRKF